MQVPHFSVIDDGYHDRVAQPQHRSVRSWTARIMLRLGQLVRDEASIVCYGSLHAFNRQALTVPLHYLKEDLRHEMCMYVRVYLDTPVPIELLQISSDRKYIRFHRCIASTAHQIGHSHSCSRLCSHHKNSIIELFVAITT